MNIKVLIMVTLAYKVDLKREIRQFRGRQSLTMWVIFFFFKFHQGPHLYGQKNYL